MIFHKQCHNSFVIIGTRPFRLQTFNFSHQSPPSLRNKEINKLIMRKVLLILLIFIHILLIISPTMSDDRKPLGISERTKSSAEESGEISENILLIYDAHLFLSDLAKIVDIEGNEFYKGQKLSKDENGAAKKRYKRNDRIINEHGMNFNTPLPSGLDSKEAVDLWKKMFKIEKSVGNCYELKMEREYWQKFASKNMKEIMKEKFAINGACHLDYIKANIFHLIKTFYIGLELVNELIGEKKNWRHFMWKVNHSPRLLDGKSKYNELKNELDKHANILKNGLIGEDKAHLNTFKNNLNSHHMLLNREKNYCWIFACFLPPDEKHEKFLKDLADAQKPMPIDTLRKLLDNTMLPWSTFSAAFGRKFKTFSEIHDRFSTFERVKLLIKKHNKAFKNSESTYLMGLNNLADRYDVELKALNGFNRKQYEHKFQKKKLKLKQAQKNESPAAPAFMDWREKDLVTPVKDQGDCGSCWAFAGIAALESQIAKKKGKLYSLSEQQCLDCSREYNGGGWGCDGGWPEVCYDYMIDGEEGKKLSGMEEQQAYPYTAKNDVCHYNPSLAVAFIKDWDYVTGYFTEPKWDELAMKEAVYNVGPLAACIDVTTNFFYYKSGIFYDPNCSDYDSPNYAGGHCIAVVGYGNEFGRDYWIVKNSWNAHWGDNGYIKMARNRENNCLIANVVSYPIVDEQKSSLNKKDGI